MRTFALACIFATTLVGCANLSEHTTQALYNPLQCQSIPGSDEQLCVAITRNRGDVWLVSGNSAYGETRLLESFSCMGGGNSAASFGEFSISPGGTYLAVVIAEEGHPFLFFRRMNTILNETEETDPLPSIPVYPGGLTIQGWRTDNLLIISSDQDLAHYRHGAALQASQDYRVYLPEGTLSEDVTIKIRKP
ncbi:MAG: hypothetical protein CO186_08250 [Zetaproteobacteria bacterium CG_4_9_14_3_um_filter_49_83]|nr:MAG: hypothetical protein AUJ56_08465 [Zetaproteobacteria bacterium CG1_02_49_23]PIQ34044.1 MAG: hypothetical protein COW62_03090 [Zetaproteobacteria bacterium CG17_big_fil_post_rev_8_21_14_2_50_50_13]PIY55908.1 MAG: hypothetical protein COZ00_07250 [Zetaproteobacteria bacterium CG_4_10_14_0_8_um_filter_49_80]PJA35038.1 MAG: hypothetical protein CO186_08250 [Zetaproteobacteria bacterium CG_4_9_14_3_um_filter_49_83]